MRATPVSSFLASRAGRSATTRRDAADTPKPIDLPDHAVAPTAAASASNPDPKPDPQPPQQPQSQSERRPLPTHRALVPTPPVVSRAADSLLALRAYGAPGRQSSTFPAGSLLRLAI